SRVKTMLITFFNVKDTISKEFVPQGTIEFYKTVMEKILARISR
ncbi:hypothetical protein EAG_02782, partial [Camponotus floridanus]